MLRFGTQSGELLRFADYVHSLNLKFGVYTAQRSETCQRRPGSYEHEAIDVAPYCAWGVDYLKIDQCAGDRYDVLNTSWYPKYVLQTDVNTTVLLARNPSTRKVSSMYLEYLVKCWDHHLQGM